MADALDHLGAGAPAHRIDAGIPGRAIGTGNPDLDQFVGGQGTVELADHAFGKPVLAHADQGMTVMRTRPQETDLSRRKHGSGPPAAGRKRGASVAQPRGPFDEVKIDLGAIIVVAAIGAPIVIWRLDGLAELILLGGYGAGAGIWLYCRTRGVLAAAHASRLERTGGP